MKDLRLTVRIQRPAEEVFAFIVNPSNTPRWIDSIVKEEASVNPIVLGTEFRNWDQDGRMNEYVVTRYEPPHIFQLDAVHQDYKLRYTCTALSDDETEFEYYEWSESGQLHAPSMQEVLDRLKEVMESHEDQES